LVRLSALSLGSLVVAAVVGITVFKLVTPHGQKEAPVGDPLQTAMPAAAGRPVNPAQQPPGVSRDIDRIVAVGDKIVTTGSQTSGDVVRQQFFVSANGGATWYQAPMQPGGGQLTAASVANLIAGGPRGWLAEGPQAPRQYLGHVDKLGHGRVGRYGHRRGLGRPERGVHQDQPRGVSTGSVAVTCVKTSGKGEVHNAAELDGWAAALDPVESHVIREAEFDADVARTARRLSGTSVGIVLSGGGARAFSHIGVLEELTAAGLTIDRVVGVSMGAVIGALFAMGRDADEIDAICFDEWVQRRPLGDYTIPRHALLRGERVQSMLHRTFGTRLIEELPRSFMCASTELRSGRLRIARHGPLWEAVGFSINVPILGPPVIRGRDMFVDGSLVDNLPVKAMADMSEGPIIAVDVKATFERPEPGPAGAAGRDDRPVRLPSLNETLMRVVLLGSENTSEAARRHADLVIKPRTHGIGLLEFHQLDAAREAGREAAREALERAPAGLLA
jgi:predicted acylesterase/phospholipase RssA